MASSIDLLSNFPRTRRSILEIVKRRGRATIFELARELSMTHEGVRSHIQQLQQEGWITVDCEAPDVAPHPTTGRPAARYCLTAAGDHAFPKHYDDLTVLLLDALLEAADGDTVRKVLTTVTDIRVEALGGAPRDLPFDARLELVTSIYLKNDPYLELKQRDGDWVIVERNCPFLNVALQRPAICSTSVSVLRRMLGCDVVRERRFQDGDGRCEFRVLRDKPLNRPPRFAPEPPKEAGR